MTESLLSPVLLAVVGLLSLLVLSNVWGSQKTYPDVPLVGRSGFMGALDFVRDGRGILQRGYDKYKGKAFAVRQVGKYVVYVSGPTLVEELRKVPEDVLSADAAATESLQAEYTLGKTDFSTHYHVPILRTQFTRNLGVMFPEIDDEIKASFHDGIGSKLTADEWIKVSAYDTMLIIIARISNRAFVGLPVCRNPEYISLGIDIAKSLISAAELLKRLPKFLRPFANKWLSAVPGNVKGAQKYLGPIITERRKNLSHYGHGWVDKPNDMLSWLIDEAKGEEATEVELVTRVLALNFAGIHTSTMIFTHILFHLAAKPDFAAPMREEIERIIAQEGWSKASLGMMHKLDSCVREALRLDGIQLIVLTRLALKPFTFSTGLHIPKGTWVSTPVAAIHGDDENYEDARTFKPFRYVSESTGMEDVKGEGDAVEEGSKVKIRSYAVATGLDYLAFGHGQHACPGRFFAVTELKMMLAHLLLNYDVKLENEGVHPRNVYFSEMVMPNTKAKVMFRKRQT